ncbi:unnamed protein product [Boreogadus saida]
MRPNRRLTLPREGTLDLSQDQAAETKTEALPDNTPFDAYRNLFWESLRELFPADAGRVGISGLTIKPEESVFQYIERAEGLWTDNNDPHSSKLATQTFQRAIIQGLPPTVQRRLRTVVSLHSKPWTEWVDHLDHHYRLEEDKRHEKDDDYEELKKQLVRMQIKEQAEKSQLHKKNRNDKGPMNMMPVAAPPPTPPTPPAPTPATPITPAPVPLPCAIYQIPACQGPPPPGWQQPEYQPTNYPGDIGSGTAPFPTANNTSWAPQYSLSISNRLPPHREYPCTPYTHRGAQRTSRRGRN